MQKFVTFDTNFLYENKDYSKLFSLKRDDEDFFVTEIVIQEIKSKNDRALKEIYGKYDEIIKSNLNQVYFKLKNQINLDSIYEKSSKKIQEFFDFYFKENIIKMYSKEEMFDELMERVRFKKAPFVDQENSSDKGFKDTLIWMSFLNFANESNHDEYTIVTSDKAFLTKQKDLLVDEFKSKFPSKIINIISNNDFLKNRNTAGIDLKEEIKNPMIDNKQTNFKKIPDQMIQETKELINNFFYHTVYGNPYEYQEYDEPRFVLNRRPTHNEVSDFIDSLVNIKDDYTFHEFVNIQEILKSMGFQFVYQREDIPISVFNQFISLFVTIRNEYPKNFDALVQFCIDNFCEVKEVNSEVEEDLPF